jgi:hypothetical protein
MLVWDKAAVMRTSNGTGKGKWCVCAMRQSPWPFFHWRGAEVQRLDYLSV